MAAAKSSVRVDAWLWAIRLFPSRSAATAACKAGHVRVDGARVKPAHVVRPGDTVRALTRGGERIVVVVGLIDKRVGAPVAVLQYTDLTPPAEVRDGTTSPAPRERGAGRPTKRDRRLVDRLRGRD